jgi:hypothetical protein
MTLVSSFGLGHSFVIRHFASFGFGHFQRGVEMCFSYRRFYSSMPPPASPPLRPGQSAQLY